MSDPDSRARGDRDGARHHPPGRHPPRRDGRRDARRPAAAPRGRQLRARPRRRGRDDHHDPRSLRPGADRGHVARGARRRRRVRARGPAPRRATVAWAPTRSRCSSTGPGAVRPDFGLDDEPTADAVTEICETVDGLPLGIELAAARMAAMSAVEVRDRLADRFRLLQGATPGPERQLTLRHAVEWSYDLLTDDERALLRTTAVFAGGFDLAEPRGSRRRRRRRRRAPPPRLARPQVARRRRPHHPPHPLRPVRDDPAVRRGSPGRARRSRGRPRPSRRVLRARGGDPLGGLGRARVARHGRLGGDRARQPPHRVPVERVRVATSRSRPTSRPTRR